jgi:flagellar basal body rod protein FlgG
VALESGDFFRVRAADGRTYFTRSGELQIDAQGYLTDEGGYRYLDNAGADMQVRSEGDAGSGVTIAANGDVTDERTGSSLNRTLGVFRVADRDALLPAGHGRLVDAKQQDVVAVPTTAIRQGNVEASNVETVSELVHMMVVQRSFEATATVLRHIGQLQSSFVNAVTR